jgi:hypothetical protein
MRKRESTMADLFSCVLIGLLVLLYHYDPVLLP